jgi:hypothetical protein
MSNNCVKDIHRETNERIYNRNIPSTMLQPYLDVRPVMTKYSHFPIVDPRKKLDISLMQMPVYNLSTTFNPGNTTSPWSGFSSNINTESELRNQIFALQKCSQSVYVPQSTSDLYMNNLNPLIAASEHRLLFKEESFNDFNPNPDKQNIATSIFMNSTRTQLKDSTTNL